MQGISGKETLQRRLLEPDDSGLRRALCGLRARSCLEAVHALRLIHSGFPFELMAQLCSHPDAFLQTRVVISAVTSDCNLSGLT